MKFCLLGNTSSDVWPYVHFACVETAVYKLPVKILANHEILGPGFFYRGRYCGDLRTFSVNVFVV